MDKTRTVLPTVLKREYDLRYTDIPDVGDDGICFLQPWLSADAQTGVYGGTSENPVPKTYLNVNATENRIEGTLLTPVGDTANHNCDLDLTTPIKGKGRFTWCGNGLSSAIFSGVWLRFYDGAGTPALICEVFWGASTGRNLLVRDNDENDLVNVNPGSAIQHACFDLTIDLIEKQMYFACREAGVSESASLNISGTMNSTEIATINCYMQTIFVDPADMTGLWWNEIRAFQL